MTESEDYPIDKPAAPEQTTTTHAGNRISPESTPNVQSCPLSRPLCSTGGTTRGTGPVVGRVSRPECYPDLRKPLLLKGLLNEVKCPCNVATSRDARVYITTEKDVGNTQVSRPVRV